MAAKKTPKFTVQKTFEVTLSKDIEAPDIVEAAQIAKDLTYDDMPNFEFSEYVTNSVTVWGNRA